MSERLPQVSRGTLLCEGYSCRNDYSNEQKAIKEIARRQSVLCLSSRARYTELSLLHPKEGEY